MRNDNGVLVMGRNRESDPKTGKPVASSAGRFWGWNTIYGRDGEHGSPYMTRVWFWGLRLHIFHRPDLDEDCHDHPWDFTTFPIWPIHGYVEEVVDGDLAFLAREQTVVAPQNFRVMGRTKTQQAKSLQVVPAFRFSFRPATHCHRVLGAYSGKMVADLMPSADAPEGVIHEYPQTVGGKIVTLVWRGKPNRAWGFLKNRDGKWCWIAWRDYVFAGGKDGPCQ